jgi:hypothetical protein
MKSQVLLGMFCVTTTCFGTGFAGAQEVAVEPLVTDRPDFTESTSTIPDGRLQVEAGYSLTRTDSARDHTFGEVLLRYGLNQRTELRVGLNSFQLVRDSVNGNVSGKDEPSLGFKWQLSQGSEEFRLAKPQVALIAATSLPVGNRNLREKRLQPGVKLCLAWDVTERLGMASNLNYDYASAGGERFNQFSASLSLAYSLTERVGTFFEVYGFVPDSPNGPDTKYFNTGLTYLVNPDFQLDARVGVGLNNPAAPDYFVGVGAARRF